MSEVPASRSWYSAWTGTREPFDLGVDDVVAAITDDVLTHGDLAAALRRLLQDGLVDRDGRELVGLRELMERLRERRRGLLDQHQSGDVFGEVTRRVRDVVDTERATLDALEADAEASGDRRRQEITDATVTGRRQTLDLLSPDLAGQIRDLSAYEFASAEAARAFEELTADLRDQLLRHQVARALGEMARVTPADVARSTEMIAELNTMLDDRAQGRDPDFSGFMDRHGDGFPERPEDLDELLQVLVARMAGMRNLWASMGAEERTQMQALAGQLLDDLDLQWELDRLERNLQELFPDTSSHRAYELTGADPLDLVGAGALFLELEDLDRLEHLLRSAADPGALAEADLDRVRSLLGDDAADSLGRLGELTRTLTEAGLIERRDGRLELTAAGLRRIGTHALTEVFRTLDSDRVGAHAATRDGVGHERSETSRPHRFGDRLDLDIHTTIRNALRRSGGGSPVTLLPDDFAVVETEEVTRTATVVLLDLSLSMPMRGNFLPAKKVAMALHTLIARRFPGDFLGIVGFSEVARVIEPHELPAASWDHVYGTNMQHAFALARRLLERERGTRQILMITDGEPTAHLAVDGEVVFHYPPLPETIDATLAEVARCTRSGITINSFVLDAGPLLARFATDLARRNRGRVFFCSPDDLGAFVLVDFLSRRRQTVGGL